MRNLVTILVGVLFSVLVSAHEGHDHTPGSVNAPHGGVIQGTDSLYWELVTEAGGITLYPLTHELASISVKEISLNGEVTMPKKKKGEPVKFEGASDHFTAKIDSKGAYHYSLGLSFSYKGKKEKVKFQVEPLN